MEKKQNVSAYAAVSGATILALVCALSGLAAPWEWPEPGQATPGQARQRQQTRQQRITDQFPGVGSRKDWQNAMPELRRGTVAMQHKRYDSAMKHLNAALAIYPYCAQCYTSRGRTTELMGGDQAKAIDDYQKSININPNDWRSWRLLGDLYFRQNRFENAEHSFRGALNAGIPNEAREAVEKELTVTISEQKQLSVPRP